MAIKIRRDKSINLWGKTLVFEPQRSDLYLVDFRYAANNIRRKAKDYFGFEFDEIHPQYVRSVSIPEIRIKNDIIRRGNSSFSVPSWDDPLDAIKISFILNTQEGGASNDVVDFLDAWLRLTRAGRGSRAKGYADEDLQWIKLDENYRIDYKFPVQILLLKGIDPGKAPFYGDPESAEALDKMVADFSDYFRAVKAKLVSAQANSPTPEQPIPLKPEIPNWQAETFLSKAISGLEAYSIYSLENAWLAGYKLPDFSYSETNVAYVDATFYADNIFVTTAN
jgi:hypothetical protein